MFVRSIVTSLLVMLGLSACGGGGGGGPPPAPPVSNPAPTVTAVSPSTVSSGGAAFTLTVNGANFVSTSVVKWGGADRTTTFVSASQLTAAIPASDIGAAGTAAVTVVSAAPGGGTSNAMAVTIGNAAPTVSTIAPSNVAAGGSNFVLTVNGAGFIDGAVIQWNGSARTTTFVNAQTLQAPIPAADIALASLAEITVTNPGSGGGTSSPIPLTVANPLPSIATLSPALVAPGAGAFDLTVNGAGFVPSSVAKWNGADRATTFVSTTQLRVAVGAGDVAVQSLAEISVVNGGPGGGTSNAVRFFVGNPVPQVTGLDPGVVRPGTNGLALRVLGGVVVDGAVVRFKGNDVSTTYVSDTEVRASLSAQDLASADLAEVVVVNPAPAGGTSNAAILTISPRGVTERVSVASDGSEANGASDAPSTSADARFVAFTSVATNLVPGDTNAAQDIFIRDTCIGASGCTRSTLRISVAGNGTEANGVSARPSISADGRFVAFESEASNLVANDTNGVADVFVRDTCAGAAAGCTPATTRVSVASDGSQGNLASTGPSLSANGRFVAFVSPSILVLGDVLGWSDAFVRDTCSGAPAGCTPVTARVSASIDAADPSRLQRVGSAAMSASGRFVAFVNYWRLPGGNVLRSDLQVSDTCAGAGPGCSSSTALVTQYVNTTGDLAMSDRASSADGRFVVYGTNLQNSERAWLADTCRGAGAGCVASFRQLSERDSSVLLSPTSAEITPDARFVGFSHGTESAVHDTCFGAPAGCVPARVPISETADGAAQGSGLAPALDATGQWGAFASASDTLIAGDTNASRDIFIARTGYTLR